MDPAIVGAGIKLLGGLFGKKEKKMTPSQSITSTAHGARKAAEKYGFNALTMLGASNATAGAGMSMGGEAPLASALSSLGGLIADNFGDEATTRQEHNKLQNQLLRLEVDRARSVMQAPPVSAVAGIGGRSALGGNEPATLMNSGQPGQTFGSPKFIERDWLTPDRESKVMPTTYGPGVMHYDNAVTGPLTLFGDDGDPWVEYLQIPLFGGAQVLNNWAQRAAGEIVAPAIGKMFNGPDAPDGYERSGKPYWKLPSGARSYQAPKQRAKNPPRITIGAN